MDEVIKMHSKDITLGSIVKLGDFPYSYATVKQKHENGDLGLFRPYTHHADFECTSGVICYVGVEGFRSPAGVFDVIELAKPLI
jgi:hypothetical protein